MQRNKACDIDGGTTALHVPNVDGVESVAEMTKEIGALMSVSAFANIRTATNISSRMSAASLKVFLFFIRNTLFALKKLIKPMEKTIQMFGMLIRVYEAGRKRS